MRRDDNLYTRMVTPSDQVRRLRRVLDVLVALASVLDGRSKYGPCLPKSPSAQPDSGMVYCDMWRERC